MNDMPDEPDAATVTVTEDLTNPDTSELSEDDLRFLALYERLAGNAVGAVHDALGIMHKQAQKVSEGGRVTEKRKDAFSRALGVVNSGFFKAEEAQREQAMTLIATADRRLMNLVEVLHFRINTIASLGSREEILEAIDVQLGQTVQFEKIRDNEKRELLREYRRELLILRRAVWTGQTGGPVRNGRAPEKTVAMMAQPTATTDEAADLPLVSDVPLAMPDGVTDEDLK